GEVLVLIIVEVAEASEEAHCRIERTDGVELAHVSDLERRRDAFRRSTLTRGSDSDGIEIDPHRKESTPRQLDCVPAFATRHIEHMRPRCEVERPDDEVDLAAVLLVRIACKLNGLPRSMEERGPPIRLNALAIAHGRDNVPSQHCAGTSA